MKASKTYINQLNLTPGRMSVGSSLEKQEYFLFLSKPFCDAPQTMFTIIITS